MVVITLSSCPPKLKGDLSKWCFELVPGVYVGSLSKRVRELVWDRICSMIGDGCATMVYPAQTEQRLHFEVCGTQSIPVDYDGLTIMKHISGERRSESTLSAPRPAKKPDQIICNNRKYLPGDDYVVVDLETTGLDPKKDSITEIAAVKIIGNRFESSFCRYIKDVKVPEEITRITGISEALLQEKGIPIREVMTDLVGYIGGLPVVCHNADFDLVFISEGLKKTGLHYQIDEVFDTLKASRYLVKDVSNYRLPTLLAHFNISSETAHEALSDAENTYKLVLKLKEIQ